MISSHDRSGWFGASDTARIMGNWNTETFRRWWLEKLGVLHSGFTNRSMLAGTWYEHRILEAIGILRMDRQIRLRRWRIRVNLDGEDKTTVYEVKTHVKPFKLTTAYWQQCQVEMFASGKDCVLVAYRLQEEDYRNFFNPVETDRLSFHPIAYDNSFIRNRYLPRIAVLKRALKEKRTPRMEELDGDSV